MNRLDRPFHVQRLSNIHHQQPLDRSPQTANETGFIFLTHPLKRRHPARA